MFDVRWERPLHQGGWTSGLATAPGLVVVHERSTRLVALGAADGAVRWDVPIGTWPRAVVVVGSRCLVLPQHPAHVVCLDVETGRREWTVELERFVGHLVVSGDTVLVGGWRGYTPLRSLDVRTGELLATSDLRRTVRPAATAEGFLIAEPGSAAVRLVDHDLREVAAWTLPEGLVDPDHSAAFTRVGTDRFLVRCGARTAAEVAVAEGVREFVRAEHDLTSHAPDLVGGRVWLRERAGGYTTSEDGRVGWRFDIGQPLVDGIGALEDGFVVAARAGTVFRLDPHGRVRARVQVARQLGALVPAGPFLLTKGSLLAVSASL